MREIKFRAWDKENKKMYPPFDFLGYTSLNEEAQDDLLPCTGDKILMQFTGLKDKNGKEIYEGDIIKGNQGNFRVLWESGRYTVAFPKGATVQNLHTFLLSNNEKEVIGNIYENPELLTPTKRR